MTTPPDALRACLHLMGRATPHPDDADLWHDTRRQASTILAQHELRRETRRSGTRGALAWAALALLLFAIFGM